MIIRAPKSKTLENIEVGDVLYNPQTCYLVIKSSSEDYPYGLVNLSNPNDYGEFEDLASIRELMRRGDHKLYKGHQVAIEVGINE